LSRAILDAMGRRRRVAEILKLCRCGCWAGEKIGCAPGAREPRWPVRTSAWQHAIRWSQRPSPRIPLGSLDRLSRSR
jgi:hypothetical protein